MKPTIIILVFSLLFFMAIATIQRRTFEMRLSAIQAELNEYRQNKTIVLKKAKRYHGVLWAYYDRGDFRFINQKGQPCRLFRGGKGK